MCSITIRKTNVHHTYKDTLYIYDTSISDISFPSQEMSLLHTSFYFLGIVAWLQPPHTRLRHYAAYVLSHAYLLNDTAQHFILSRANDSTKDFLKLTPISLMDTRIYLQQEILVSTHFLPSSLCLSLQGDHILFNA